ncbi:hypothetical protein F2Q69_00030457 [Brassica cretica]|uniref:Uncharacterized protein n=1 Tax=Brassica cretica TaxID=69181 RepID=A0A8S9RVG8_BRACR|nr:hypothetical protein F2Q69_00030457 [Brassica cretica]
MIMELFDSLSATIDAIDKDLCSKTSRVTTHAESNNNKITQGTEGQIEECIPLYNNNSYGAHTTYMELDDNLILRSEEQAETVTFMSYYTNIDEEEVGFVENTLEDRGDDSLVVECTEESREPGSYKRALA